MAISAPTYVVSTTELTNQNVIVTATFDPSATDVTNCWSYQEASSAEPTEWVVYEGPIPIDVNGTVYLMTRKNDLSEVVTTECVISNIDTEKPTITATADKTAFTKDTVTVTATFSDNSGEFTSQEYSIDGGQTWTAYTDAGVTFADNGIVQFRATDKAGNDAEIVGFTVSNIDKEAPTIVPAGTPSVLTNQDVTVTAAFSDNSNEFASKEYSIDGGTTWVAYTDAGVTFTKNGAIQFKAVDAAGNEATASFTVDYIDKEAPTAPVPAADIANTQPTNTDVIVTATFSDDTATKQYSVDGGTTWVAYADAGVTMTQNGTVQFKAIDAATNESTASYEVTNIDKVRPVITADADVKTPTNQSVTVTASVDEKGGSGLDKTQYSIDGGTTWADYTAAGVKFDANGIVQFKATDKAGNVSEIVGFTVSNIDKVAPDAPVPAASTTDPTNQPVTVTATFSADSVVKEYSIDGGTVWTAYDAQTGVVLEDNGVVSFRGIDAATNISAVAGYTVTNIDLVAPEAPTVVASTTDPTNTNVSLTATFSADSAVKEYTVDGGTTWVAYTEPVVLTKNGDVSFRGTDAAGNVSEITSCSVTNIDKAAPTITVAADITAPTNDKVVLTPTFSDNVEVAQKKYSLDGTTWQNYSEPIAVTDNGTVSFLCSDTAGNVSQVVSYKVTNIDKVAPVVVAGATVTTPTNQDVAVFATATDDASGIASLQYSIDGGTVWSAYDAATGVVFAENGIVQFKATDVAGNVSEIVGYTVSNIDKVAPEAPTAAASTTEPTNQPVKVTATFSADSVTKEFTVDGGTVWSAYNAETGVVLDDNGSVGFRGTDAAGNVSEVTTLTVTNIDLVAPEAPVAAASTTDPTNQPVTVTATFSEDSAKQEFSIDGGTVWSAYDAETGVVFQDNGTVGFRGIDAAGNISAVTGYTVSNIDLVAPDAPTNITPSTTAPTKFDVTVTATFSADSAVKQFSFDGQDWVEYPDTGVIVKDNNTTVSFRGIDAAGNISEVSSYKVTNIDKAVPTITVSADITEPTNQNVTVTAVFEDDNGVVSQEYSFDGGLTWFDYTDPIVVEGNCTISFLAQDGVGNFTITAFTVDNIDKVPPVAPVASADYTEPTNTDVIVTAVFSEDSVKQEYSIDGGTVWSAYDAEKGVKFEENGSVLFRGIDAATNVSDLTEYIVDVIDKVAPLAPTVTLTPAAGKFINTDVLVTATFSDDTASKQYTIDGGETWLVFADDGVAITENVTISVRGIDAAGNASEAVTSVIDYIDKTVPVLTISADPTVPTVEIVGVTATVTDNTDYYEDIVEKVAVIDETTGEQAVDLEGNPIFEDKVTGQKLITNTTIMYSRDGKNWLTYKNPIKFTRNGEIFFYAYDEAGNRTEIVSYDVWNIDKTAPTLSVKATPDTPTNGIVEVEAIAEDNFDIYDDEEFTNLTIEYSRDGKSWLNYKNAIKFTRNGDIYFRATDAAGNQTSTSYKVENIDKNPPAAPVASADVTDPTNQPVTVSAVFSEDTVLGEYSLDAGETWAAYDAEAGVVFEDNGSVLFRGFDAAGNVSKFTKYEVTNIDLIPPEAPEAEASTVDPTNQPVTVFATFSDDTVSAEYSLDGEEWFEYDAEAGVVFEDNGSVFFRGYDAVGNVSDVTEYVVENIDLVPPEAPTASADITDPTNKDVTVTPVFSEDTVSGEFSLDGGETWEVYDPETGVVMEDNGTVQFRGYDAAGNVSEPFSFEVTNIDKIPPADPVASADITEPTRNPVTVTATFSDDTVYAEYSLDGEDWYEYEDGVVFEENGVVGFRGYDAVGNVSEITEYVVTNIDLIPPEEPIVFADVTTDTNRSVTLTAVFDEDAVTKQYSLDGEEWLAYDAEKGVVADENGKFFFRGIDAVGNISEVTEYDVTNIDKVAPVAPVVSADVTAPTKGAVTVTAVFAEDSVSNLYSLDEGKTWLEYTEGIKFEKNGLVMFISHDLAGNFSYTGFFVDNIDLIAPDAPQLLSVEPRDFTNKAIVVKADFTDDSAVKEYSLDKETWLAYDAEKGVTVDANGSVFFRAADAVGNTSEVSEFKVWNIDTTAPEAATGLTAVVSDQTVALVWTPSLDDLSGIAEYTVTYGHDDKSFTAKTADARFLIENADYATWSWSVTATDAAGNTSAVAKGADFVVSEEPGPGPGPEPGPTPVATLAKNDIDGNGISDVLFQWTSGDGQIGFWMNGTNDWQGQAQPHDALWGVIGTYDMTADGKADLIMAGPAQIVDKGGLYIGYYIDSVDTDANWRTIGFLSSTDTSWNILAGNLTGTVGKNSIVWYSKDIYSLGIWKDGEEEWVALSDKFGGEDWTIAGIGDFDGDGKDSVLMSFQYSKQLYSVDIDGTATSLGAADWSGWDVAAIGDFAGDGKEDIVLFNQDLGSMVMLADGNADQFTSIGQLDAEDWFIVGAGDYNNDQKDDLLVRQFSTGMLGYYSTADQSKWVELGRGVDTNWTVIA